MNERIEHSIESGGLSETYFYHYLRGNMLWPQKHLAHPIFIADEALRSGETLLSLYQQGFSTNQVLRATKAMNHAHTHNGVDRLFQKDDGSALGGSIMAEDVSKLWRRGVVEGANWVGSILSLMEPDYRYSDLRAIYRMDYESTRTAIHMLDAELARSEGRTVISDMFSTLSHRLHMPEFKKHAHTYRKALTEARSKKDELLDFKGELLTKTAITQKVVDSLCLSLRREFPTVSWGEFKYLY